VTESLKVFVDPHGGYELGRKGNQISADDILRAASAVEDGNELLSPGPTLVNEVVRPALAEIERTFSAALGRIVISDMIKLAEALK
jgi:DNA-binding IscR family transcriptional regulator